MSRVRENPGQGAERVLVIKLSALGDFVMSLGAMAEVRRQHPTARITLLTTPPYAAFAESCPYVDEVDPDGRPRGEDSGARTRAMLRRISEARFDIAYDFQTNERTNWYYTALRLNPAWRAPPLSGKHLRAAWPATDPAAEPVHPVERLTRQLELAGLGPAGGYAGPLLPSLDWVDTAQGGSPRLLPAYFGLEGPFALLLPGASAHRTQKIWPAGSMAEIARRLADQGIAPVLVGTKAESDAAAVIRKAEPRAVSLITRTDLFQLAALGARAELVVGGDTGPMHMAAAAGAPAVCLFALEASSPAMAAPRGPSAVATVAAARMRDINPDHVWSAVESLALPALAP